MRHLSRNRRKVGVWVCHSQLSESEDEEDLQNAASRSAQLLDMPEVLGEPECINRFGD